MPMARDSEAVAPTRGARQFFSESSSAGTQIAQICSMRSAHGIQAMYIH